MAMTNFGLLTNEQLTVWQRDMWHAARNYSFINKFLGSDANSVIQRITELKKTEKGARAVLTLVADLTGDGVVGDRQLEGNEEAIQSYDQVIRIDQMRHANLHEGRLAEQKSVVNFREESRNVLAYWLADRMDQLAFLTLSGVSYAYKNDGTTRVGSDFPSLEFGGDISAPSTKRLTRWDSVSGLVTSGAATTDVDVSDTITWQSLIDLKAYAKEQYVRGIKESGGEETFHVFMTPKCMARLKMDQDYMLNLRHAQPRESGNPLFTGGAVKVDNLYLHEYRHVFHSSTWGGGSVEGCQVLFCGAQAMGMADIGDPLWVEKQFDYENRPGISVAKMLGFLKPKFRSIYAGTTVPQDFGVLSMYVAQ